MDHPITSQQFAARLTADDLVLLNELIPEIFPDIDLSVKDCLTGRQIVMALAERALAKVSKNKESKPEDLSKIAQLETHVQEITGQYNLLNEENENLEGEIELKANKIAELEARILQLQNQLSGIETEATSVKEKAQKLEKYVPVPNEMRIVFQPLTLKVLLLYAEKIRLRQKIEITPGELLESLFNRYITKRETELPGFPFLISKQEIINLAKELQNDVSE